MRIIHKILILLLLTLLLNSCSTISSLWEDKTTDDEIEEPAEIIFGRAEASFNSGNYKAAAKAYEEVERLHPYSNEARLSIMKAARSSFSSGKYFEAITASKRFLNLYPSDEQAEYALYLVGQSYYHQIVDIKRDQGMTVKSKEAFEELIRKYPKSKWSKDARFKIDLTNDNLAGKEMEIGRFYLKKKNYLASINRFKEVVNNYQKTAHIEEALMRLTELYLTLGTINEAKTAASILGQNYPSGKWYKRAYSLLKTGGHNPEEDKSSWISKAFSKVF